MGARRFAKLSGSWPDPPTRDCDGRRSSTTLLAMRLSRGVLLALSLMALVPGCKKEEDEPAPAGTTCGKKPLPDCPTQKWMKEHMKPAFDQKDTAKLATALDEVAAHAPPGFTGWDTISKKGA